VKKIIIVNSLIFFFLIVALECFIRFFDLANPLGYDKNLYNHSNNLITHNPNIVSKVFGKTVFTDSNGFRIPKKNFIYSKNNSILILGDSTSFGSGVIEEKTFIGLLRQNSNNNFYNASVAGHSLKDHIASIKRYSPKIDFSKIVIFLNIDDIKSVKLNDNNKINKIKKNNLNFINNLKSVKILSDINIFFRDKSTLYVFLKSSISKPQSRIFKDIYKDYFKEENLNSYTNELNSLINYLPNVLDKEIYFILLPFEFQTRAKNCNKEYLVPQKIIEEIMSLNRVNYFDFTNQFCNSINPHKLYLPFDPAHLSKKGNQLVRDTLLKSSSLFRD
tara:strand:- start:144 stop:1139 length:996 start_codon:yes stop_codon:yes gene_type:complete